METLGAFQDPVKLVLMLLPGRGKGWLQLLNFVVEQLIDFRRRMGEVASSLVLKRPLKYVVRPQRLLQALTMPPGMINDRTFCSCLPAPLDSLEWLVW